MIHVNSITAALLNAMAGDGVLVSSGFTVQEGEVFNQDINMTPWVGIYYGHLDIDPHTLGGTRPWAGNLELFVYVQQGSHRSGQEATRLLSMAQGAVLDVIDADKNLGGAVQRITGMEIAPFQRELEDDSWLFTNEITLKAAVRG
ncbi:MAG: hypothetical protein IIC13_18800 [SAR324 cluster bacterium]|nr:hypothetical protein [SAR324 cluster bacterium]MCH8888633.1 hypothetical protein [SAR324 cluster bacterium]